MEVSEFPVAAIGSGGSSRSGTFDRSRTLITRRRDEREMPGHRRYRSGRTAYSMDEEGDRSSSPSRSFRFSSEGGPSTNQTPPGTPPVPSPGKMGGRLG